MNAINKHVISPWLLASLEHFSKPVPTIRETKPMATLFVYQDKDGGRHSVSIEHACGMALQLLQDEDLYILKFRHLQDWFRRNHPKAYEQHMGEKLP